MNRLRLFSFCQYVLFISCYEFAQSKNFPLESIQKQVLFDDSNHYSVPIVRNVEITERKAYNVGEFSYAIEATVDGTTVTLRSFNIDDVRITLMLGKIVIIFVNSGGHSDYWLCQFLELDDAVKFFGIMRSETSLQLPIGYFNVRNVAMSNVIFKQLVPFTETAKLYVMSYNNITATNEDDVVFLLRSQQHKRRHIRMLFPSKSFDLGIRNNRLYFAMSDVFDTYVMHLKCDRQSEDVFNKIKKYARNIVTIKPELEEDDVTTINGGLLTK